MPCLGKAHKSPIELPERRRTEVIRVESWNGGMAVLRFGTFDGDTTKLTENSSFAWCPAPVMLDVLLLTEFQSVEIQKYGTERGPRALLQNQHTRELIY